MKQISQPSGEGWQQHSGASQVLTGWEKDPDVVIQQVTLPIFHGCARSILQLRELHSVFYQLKPCISPQNEVCTHTWNLMNSKFNASYLC